MNKNAKIYIAGHMGLVGSALLKKLTYNGFTNLITRSRKELNLLDQNAVAGFFATEKPEYVFFSAGKTGGIYANNTYRADFIYENTVMQSNVIHQSFLHEIKKLMFYACSCIYPRQCPQPMKEEYILIQPLEYTNEPFGIAKIAGLKMCESYNRQYGTEFISVIPTNIYGPKQHYEPINSLVLPSLIQKIHQAKNMDSDEVILWGSGLPRRDFLYVDDAADASIFIMENYDGIDPVNFGSDVDYSIAELADIIKFEIGYNGNIVFDTSYPDGVQNKLQDISVLKNLGWQQSVSLHSGIHITYNEFCLHHNTING